jgi:hypothetical protein
MQYVQSTIALDRLDLPVQAGDMQLLGYTPDYVRFVTHSQSFPVRLIGIWEGLNFSPTKGNLKGKPERET